MGVGSPISALNGAALNALRAPMVVDAALGHLAEGHKPLIAFQSTNESVLREIYDADGVNEDMPMTFSRTAARVHERLLQGA